MPQMSVTLTALQEGIRPIFRRPPRLISSSERSRNDTHGHDGDGKGRKHRGNTPAVKDVSKFVVCMYVLYIYMYTHNAHIHKYAFQHTYIQTYIHTYTLFAEASIG